MNCRATVLTVFLCCLLGTMAAPALAENAIPWHKLSNGEQKVLQKHRRNWPILDYSEQTHLRRGARNYLKLSPDKLKAVNQQRNQYKNMTAEERRRLRKQYTRQKK